MLTRRILRKCVRFSLALVPHHRLPGLPRGRCSLVSHKLQRSRSVRHVEYSIWISGRIGLTFQGFKTLCAPSDPCCPLSTPRCDSARAFAILVMLVPLSTGLAVAQDFKFSKPDESDRIEKEAREDRIAEQLVDALPRRASKTRRSWS